MTLHQATIDEARDCARLFRLGRDIEGALKMVELIDRSMPLLGEMSAVDQAKGAQVLGEILTCQERQDWIGLADWLEVEFVELF
jgi:hypothetical protein